MVKKITNDKPVNFKVRSFVRRQGRITTAQRRALDELLTLYCLPRTETLNFADIFGNSNPCVLEIGFGNGNNLVLSARENPAINYIGIEVHLPGIGRTLNNIQKYKLKNLRLSEQDAILVMENQLNDSSLAQINLFFPDPWHKKRHHKRRIVNESFLTSVTRVLKPGGKLHIATDWQEYALYIIELGSRCLGLEILNSKEDQAQARHETKFERRAKRLGRRIWDIVLVKT